MRRSGPSRHSAFRGLRSPIYQGTTVLTRTSLDADFVGDALNRLQGGVEIIVRDQLDLAEPQDIGMHVPDGEIIAQLPRPTFCRVLTDMRKGYLDHGILELDNNAAERAMRAIALGRKNYLFFGSEAGGKTAAIAYTLIETAKLNAIDPHAWLADTIARIPDYRITKVDDLLPWRWNG